MDVSSLFGTLIKIHWTGVLVLVSGPFGTTSRDQIDVLVIPGINV
jgi:hypothetical protein